MVGVFPINRAIGLVAGEAKEVTLKSLVIVAVLVTK